MLALITTFPVVCTNDLAPTEPLLMVMEDPIKEVPLPLVGPENNTKSEILICCDWAKKWIPINKKNDKKILLTTECFFMFSSLVNLFFQ